MPQDTHRKSRCRQEEGIQKGMCRRTEGKLFPRIKNGQGRGQTLGRDASVLQSPLFKSGDQEDVNSAQDDLVSLKEQYQLVQETLRSIEKKIAELESRK